MPADDAFSAWDAAVARGSPSLTVVGGMDDRPPLVLRPARLPLPSTIPPRPWLYGTQLIRGFVTVLVAPGGTGKSAYAMAMAAALACGRPVLGTHVFKQCNVAVYNLEDPMDELERRLAAICIKHDIQPEELKNRYFLNSGEDRPLTMASLSDDGFSVIHPDEDAVIREIRAHDIGFLVVDPYAESHSLEENSNPQMVRAAAAWRRVARATNAAIMLVHHVRKGAALDMDAARGAKALTDSARVGLLLTPMSEEEARALDVPEDIRTRYVQMINAKANLAPPPGKGTWFQLSQVDLHNASDDYPSGDKVAAITSWEPPNLWARMSPADLNRALDIIATPPAGWLYAPTRRGQSSARWAGQVVRDVLDCSDDVADQVIKTWLRNGTLVLTEYHDADQRKARKGVRVNDAHRPT